MGLGVPYLSTFGYHTTCFLLKTFSDFRGKWEKSGHMVKQDLKPACHFLLSLMKLIELIACYIHCIKMVSYGRSCMSFVIF